MLGYCVAFAGAEFDFHSEIYIEQGKVLLRGHPVYSLLSECSIGVRFRE